MNRRICITVARIGGQGLTRTAPLIALFSLCLWQSAAIAACPPVPSWASGRTGSCDLQVDAGGSWGTVTFQDETAGGNRNEVGTHRSHGSNHIWYDVVADGYEGRPPGSCIQNGACPWQNNDVGHIWGGRSEQIVLVKNVEIKNAFKTVNGPHVDTLQGYQAGLATVSPVSVINTILRNSDDQILLYGNMHSAPLVFQNVLIEQEAWFDEDCLARNTDPWCGATNGIFSDVPTPVWLVHVDIRNTANLRIGGNVTELILIGTNESVLDVEISADRVRRYASIEAALSAGHAEPPFLRLACAGWASPPAGCDSRLGADGSAPPGPSGGGSGGTPPGEGGGEGGGGSGATPSISKLILYDTDSGLPIHDPWNGEDIDIQSHPNVSVEAIVSGAPGSVLFSFNGSALRTENGAPYAIIGDSGPGALHPWTSIPQGGQHVLRVIPFTEANTSGEMGTEKTLLFQVEGSTALGVPGKPELLH